jgi:hypothetical protein
MGYLGDRIRISARRQTKSWRELWQSIYASPTPITKTPPWLRAWHARRLQEAISRLQATPKSAARLRKIAAHRRQLAKVMGQVSGEG